jgi:sulfate permease, SulP family
VKAGATSPVAGMVHAAVLLAAVVLAAPLAVHVPLAVLAGILLFVAWNMFSAADFKALAGQPLSNQSLMLSTFGLTVAWNLIAALGIGLLLALWFAQRQRR